MKKNTRIMENTNNLKRKKENPVDCFTLYS